MRPLVACGRNGPVSLTAGLAVLLVWALTGCVTYQPKSKESTSPPVTAAAPSLGAYRIRVQPVTNRTGQSRYDCFALYVQQHAARLLHQSGKYEVVDEGGLSRAAAKLRLPLVNTTAQGELTVEILEVKESTGGTLSLGIVSTQSRSVRVKVEARFTDLGSQATTASAAEASSSKGAWGVLATVDRDSMLEGNGYWKLDQDALGIAGQSALQKAMNRLLATPPPGGR